MDDLTAWSILVGTVAPLVIAVAQRPGWSNTARVAISVIFCTVAGAVTAVLDGTITPGPLTFSSVLHGSVAVIAAAQVTYRAFWKPTGVTDSIERATSPADTLR